ncbi:16S rRNA (guanine(966)-N(2))-methyltransferase RsmD [Legionella oakridgensis]|uniref:16S rRNA (guanine(966)-N(2))-methyltransferase RsmD n=1 Tax=Legionella oakridgensis TaxID=29423 RepID=UPI0003DE6D71|nr:16S rRNA (guanine(966)-N(2))-methyltransferase RsmD [Legionella oakridgensis]ETO92282.1 RNA methyltransferase, RsmD family [Legionella oakridgensis RV-2-2007]
MKQVIRIIGGRFRGKKLRFPALEGLRPTPDRVRETLFNWLMHDIRGSRCLDAFAGSGALGLEAFSRGASKVTFVEQSAKAYTNLKSLILEFDPSSLNVIKADAREYLRQTDETFDIIFFDPPFAKNYILHCLPMLEQTEILPENGLLYLEAAHEIVLDTSIWQTIRLKRAGQVIYALYRKIRTAS